MTPPFSTAFARARTRKKQPPVTSH
jgi:hypothetical protein